MRLILLATAVVLGAGPASAGPAPAGPAPAGAPLYDASTVPAPAGDMPVIKPGRPSLVKCPPISRYHAMKRGGPLTAQKLADLPPADTYKAAYRVIDGCEAPIIARYGVQGSP